MASEAAKLTKYLESLTITQGPRSGEKFKVLPWQKRFISGFLRSQVSALSVARGNGKTTLLAGIAAAAMAGPLAKPRGECLLVAGSFSQAKTAFDHVLSFLPNRSRYRVHDTAQQAEIIDKETGTMVKCHGATRG